MLEGLKPWKPVKNMRFFGPRICNIAQGCHIVMICNTVVITQKISPCSCDSVGPTMCDVFKSICIYTNTCPACILTSKFIVPSPFYCPKLWGSSLSKPSTPYMITSEWRCECQVIDCSCSHPQMHSSLNCREDDEQKHGCVSHVCLTNGMRTMVLMRICRCLHCRIHHCRGPANCVRNIVMQHNICTLPSCNSK